MDRAQHDATGNGLTCDGAAPDQHRFATAVQCCGASACLYILKESTAAIPSIPSKLHCIRAPLGHQADTSPVQDPMQPLQPHVCRV